MIEDVDLLILIDIVSNNLYLIIIYNVIAPDITIIIYLKRKGVWFLWKVKM